MNLRCNAEGWSFQGEDNVEEDEGGFGEIGKAEAGDVRAELLAEPAELQ